MPWRPRAITLEAAWAVVNGTAVNGTGAPSRFSAPLTATVYRVPGARGAVGVTKTRRPPSAVTMRAETGPEGALSTTLVSLIVPTRSGCDARRAMTPSV